MFLHYYGLFRPCALHRYFRLHGFSTSTFPLASKPRFPRSMNEPVFKSRHLYTGHHSDRLQVTSEFIRGEDLPHFGPISFFRCFNDDLLALVSSNTYLTWSCSCLFHDAHDHNSLLQPLMVVCNPACPLIARGLPSSHSQLCISVSLFYTFLTSVLSRHTVNRQSGHISDKTN